MSLQSLESSLTSSCMDEGIGPELWGMFSFPSATVPMTAGMAQLDRALRCPVCGDWFRAAVLLKCGHSCFVLFLFILIMPTFVLSLKLRPLSCWNLVCSLCIRKHLSVNQSMGCPSCRKPTCVSDFVKNVHLDTAVG